MAKRRVAPTPVAQEALVLLGQQIRLGRHRKKWSTQGLAERLGISENTMRSIEQGSASVAVGTVFNAAVKVGVPLFTEDHTQLSQLRRQSDQALQLLPTRVRDQEDKPDDSLYDF